MPPCSREGGLYARMWALQAEQEHGEEAAELEAGLSAV